MKVAVFFLCTTNVDCPQFEGLKSKSSELLDISFLKNFQIRHRYQFSQFQQNSFEKCEMNIDLKIFQSRVVTCRPGLLLLRHLD